MPKNSYIRILLLFGMALVFVNGCVDTSVQPIPSTVEYKSSVKIVNLAVGVSSAEFSTKTPDGTTNSFGTIGYGNEDANSGFTEVPAGAKTLSFNSESLKFSTDVDRKMRIIVWGDAANRDFTKLSDRYIFQTTDDTTIFKSGKGAVAFINASDGDIDAIQAVRGSETTDISTATLAQGDIVSYTFMQAGQYTFNFMVGDSVVSSAQQNVESLKRYTAAVYGTQSSLQNKVFTDD